MKQYGHMGGPAGCHGPKLALALLDYCPGDCHVLTWLQLSSPLLTLVGQRLLRGAQFVPCDLRERVKGFQQMF